MHQVLDVKDAIAATEVGLTTSANGVGMAKLTVLHRELIQTLPMSSGQEIRVIKARLDPGDHTPHHSHRFPVTVFMIEGVFTLELDGREPIAIGEGQVFIEPSNVTMTGRNLSADQPAVMILFYVSEPDTPFADPA